MAAIVGAAGLRPDPGRGAARRHGGAGQQGVPGLRRRPVHARGAPPWAPRCCRSIPSTTRSSRRCAAADAQWRRAADPDRLGRAVPRLERGRDGGRRPSQAVAPPQLVHGRQDQRRQRDDDEQGPRDDRGPPSVPVPESGRSRSLVHPQSIVHSLVAFSDGSVLAQLGEPDMRIPIAYTLGWPARLATAAPRLDLCARSGLDLRAAGPRTRFPALRPRRLRLAAGRRRH